MSYQVLARKWRPPSFAALVGQEHIVRALAHALETGRLHHAWLFTGTRGVGKTTISRILAKALNCETGVTPTPCGECETCRAIDADRFPDYVEMDAASNRGVDDMAALLDRAVYAPVQGRYKVYMIDEVHMLTGHAFNAMLKTLEEPPEHVKFILATTDPQKIPVTVLSRCLQFNLKQMSPGAIVDHLAHVLAEEGVEFERAALTHLARAADGSMRDALSLLEQAIAHGAGKLEEEGVSRMLGTVGDDHLFSVLDALLVNDVEAMLAVADDMEMRSLSFDAALQALALLLSRVALAQFAAGALADDERERLAPYAESWDAEFLQLAYQIAIHGREELSLAPDEYTGFTMTLLRLAAFSPIQPPALNGPAASGGGERPRPVSRPSQRATPSAQPDAAKAEAPSVRTVVEPSVSKPESQSEPAPFVAADVPPWEEDVPPATPEDRPLEAAEAFEVFASEQSAQGAAAADVKGAMSAAMAAGDWHALQRVLAPSGLVRELCQNCEWLNCENDQVTLRLTETHRHLLDNPTLVQRLTERLSECAGRPMRVSVEVGEIENVTPAQIDHAAKQARHAEAVTALRKDPFVTEIIERFDAQFVESSVKPV